MSSFSDVVRATLRIAGGELSFAVLNEMKLPSSAARPPGKLEAVLQGIPGVVILKRGGVKFAALAAATRAVPSPPPSVPSAPSPAAAAAAVASPALLPPRSVAPAPPAVASVSPSPPGLPAPPSAGPGVLGTNMHVRALLDATPCLCRLRSSRGYRCSGCCTARYGDACCSSTSTERVECAVARCCCFARAASAAEPTWFAIVVQCPCIIFGCCSFSYLSD